MSGCCRGLSAQACIARPYGCFDTAEERDAYTRKIPCPYCTNAYTGLPGNACENCMNTGYIEVKNNEYRHQ